MKIGDVSYYRTMLLQEVCDPLWEMNHSCLFFLSKQKELHALHGQPNENTMRQKVNAAIFRNQG